MIDVLANNITNSMPSFYPEYFEDDELLRTLNTVSAILADQAQKSALELLQMISIDSIPVYANINMLPITFSSDDVLEVSKFTYGSGFEYGDKFDTGANGTVPIPYGPDALGMWRIPLGRHDIVSCGAVSQTILAKGKVLVGSRFMLDGGYLYFYEDPFTTFSSTIYTSSIAGVVHESMLTVFLCNVDIDKHFIYDQAGTLIGPRAPSSEAYRDFVSAVYAAAREGMTVKNLRDIAYAAASGGRALSDEVVEFTGEDDGDIIVATDKHVYRVI